MPRKPKIALYWCSSCGGCEESIVDLAEDLLAVTAAVDIVFWPVAIDAKYRDLAALADGELAAALINGSIRMDEQAHMAKLLRQKSKLVFAQGSCAHLGGVYGLANFFDREEILSCVYDGVPSVDSRGQEKRPQVRTMEGHREVTLSGFHSRVKALDQVVAVDYYIPGCPSTPQLIKRAISMVLDGSLPARGSVLADHRALCHTCPRIDSRPEVIRVRRFSRLHETQWDPNRCFLAEGLVCLGPATRGGCGARCIGGNMPCRGCFGPLDRVSDQGAKSLAFLAAMVEGRSEDEAADMADSIPDPAGLFYRYSLPSSLLKGRVMGRRK